MLRNLSDSEIAEILAAGMSPRCARLDKYQRYVDGTIYDGRPPFLSGTDAPLSERAPCVVYRAVPNAIESFSTMCLGKGRFPIITSLTSEDDEAFDDRFGLNPADSETLDTGITKISKQTRFPTFCQQALETAMGSGTAIALLCIVKGKLQCMQLDPKHTEPTYAEDDPSRIVSVECRYRYTEDVWDGDQKKYVKIVYQYRRVIDEIFDITYVPVMVDNKDSFPVPTTEKTKYRHDFGFCPVVWYKFLSKMAASGDKDGRPVHFGVLGNVDAINVSLSQRHRAARYCGDPQVVETGVEDDDARMPMGRQAATTQLTADPSGWDMSLSGRKTAGRASEVRKKGAGTVWRYASPDAKVEYLLLSGDALKALENDVADNIGKLREDLGHVYIDPKDISGGVDISGKTLALMFETQIRKCNKIREDFGECFILPVLNMLFRIILKSGKGLYLAGVQKLQKILQRFEQPIEGVKGVTWFEPMLELKWGDYFEPSDTDEATRVTTAIQALTSETPIITRKTAVEHVAGVFGIKSADQYEDSLQEEADEKEAKLHEAMAAMNGDDGGADAPAAKPAAARGASGGPAAKPRPAKPSRAARSAGASA